MSVAGQQAQNKQSERHGRRKPYYDVFGDERFIFYYVVASKKENPLWKPCCSACYNNITEKAGKFLCKSHTIGKRKSLRRKNSQLTKCSAYLSNDIKIARWEYIHIRCMIRYLAARVFYVFLLHNYKLETCKVGSIFCKCGIFKYELHMQFWGKFKKRCLYIVNV